jgi:hypothetical protein
MKPVTADAKQPNTLEDLGRATLQIVHDLKNQLNGLKLYATFLRKRLERDDQPTTERETLAKLIAGLDQAASEMTALVRYAQPLDLQKRPGTDLRKIISSLVAESTNRDSGGLERPPLAAHIDDSLLLGEFDGPSLIDAFKAITKELRHSAPAKDGTTLSLHIHRDGSEAIIEWRGGKFVSRHHIIQTANGCGSVLTAFAAKVIEGHGGKLQCSGEAVSARLPLSN